jgi:hypothetical protein
MPEPLFRKIDALQVPVPDLEATARSGVPVGGLSRPLPAAVLVGRL